MPAPVRAPATSVLAAAAKNDDVAVGASFDASKMPGVLPPTGFFDPWNLAKGKTETRMRWFREAELKHGRISMLAALGFLVQEGWGHPFFGGNVDAPSLQCLTDPTFAAFWGPLSISLHLIEGQAVNKAVRSPFTEGVGMGFLQDNHELGDYGFDPMGYKSALNDEEYRNRKNQELANGRLAMLGIAGMVAQEAVTGQKLFGSPVSAAEMDNLHNLAVEMSDMLNATLHM